jgi:hypothetical protein
MLMYLSAEGYLRVFYLKPTVLSYINIIIKYIQGVNKYINFN